MVRNYKRVTDRQRWSKANLTAATEAVKHGGVSVKRAAKEHGIPRQTLVRYLKLEPQGNFRHAGSYSTVFSQAEEAELVEHILKLEVSFYGVTARDVRSLAFQLAEKNGKTHPFSKEKQLAGVDWLTGFRKRNPKLSFRTPEATSAARAQGFNRVAVNTFYDVLEKELATGKFSPSRIYNVDETSVVTVQTKKSKILALRGRRQVGCITSAERGLLSTACICMSATGHFLPPMLIFARARLTEQLKNGAPADSIFICNSTGWMTVVDFNTWFDHFLKHTRPTSQNPVLLLLDGHVSHTKNLAFLEKAVANNVTVVCLPPHCSHKLQPLDVSFMGPFKTNFSKAVESFLKNNPGKVVTLNEISGLLGKAFMQTSHSSIAINGFRKTGIVPFNRYGFEDNDFAPSDVTDIPMEEVIPGTDEVEDDGEPPFYGFEDVAAEKPSGERQVLPPACEAGPSTSFPRDHAAKHKLAKPGSSSVFAIPPSAVLPIPKSAGRKAASTRKREKAANITGSPHRSALKQLQATRDISQLKKEKKARLKAVSKNGSEVSKRKRGRPSKAEKLNLQSLLQDSLCDLCGTCFSSSNDGQGWRKCNLCLLWFHECCGVDCPSCHP